MSLLDAQRRFAEQVDGRLGLLERTAKIMQAQINDLRGVNGNPHAGGSALYASMARREVIAPVRVVQYVVFQSGGLAGGWYECRRQRFSDLNNGTLVDDPELDAVIYARGQPQHGVFPEARGFARYMGSPRPWETAEDRYTGPHAWALIGGEWEGMSVELTNGVADSAESYAWSQVLPPGCLWSSAHSSGSLGVNVFDHAIFSRDPLNPLSNRVNFIVLPAKPVFRVHYFAGNGVMSPRFYFAARREQGSSYQNC